MEYRLNFEKIIDDYKFGKGTGNVQLQHNTGKRINILPYNTKYENKHKEFVENFKSAVGEFSRLISNKEHSEQAINEEWINTIVEKIDLEDKDRFAFKAIVNELFFNETGEIDTFHPAVLNYVKKDSSGDFNKNLAQFLYDVLLELDDEELENLLKELYSFRTSNILINLVLDSLPKLEDKKKNIKKKYKAALPFVSSLFNEDFKFMLKKPKFFVDNFEKLLRLYYFFYTAQLTLKMKSFFRTEYNLPEKLYFTLDWESTSKARTSYKEGWKLLSSNIESLFSHANCLELINHSNQVESFLYLEIRDIISSVNENQRESFRQDLENLKQDYKKYINDVDWERLTISRLPEDDVEKEIYELFYMIEYQFKNSTRKKPYLSYAKRFEDFCKLSYLKQRGSLGYTLNMTEENLIFITKLCIKDEGKIKLKTLFKEYEKRGIYFDRDSQNKIIQLFEKLNLIEKKSDSGDAQYVKSVL